MTASKTIGDELIALRARSGLSLAAIAQAAGYAGPSSIQAYFRHDYDPISLPYSVSQKLEKAMVGAGDPPITLEEFFNLISPSMARQLSRAENFVSESSVELSRNLPVLAPELNVFHIDGQDIEVHETSESDRSFMFRPMPLMAVSNAYAIYVAGRSMEPRYRPGELLIVNPLVPPAPGDDVVINLKEERVMDAGAYEFRFRRLAIKTLVERSAQRIVVEEFQPHRTITVSQSDVAQIHRVAPLRELLV